MFISFVNKIHIPPFVKNVSKYYVAGVSLLYLYRKAQPHIDYQLPMSWDAKTLDYIHFGAPIALMGSLAMFRRVSFRVNVVGLALLGLTQAFCFEFRLEQQESPSQKINRHLSELKQDSITFRDRDEKCLFFLGLASVERYVDERDALLSIQSAKNAALDCETPDGFDMLHLLAVAKTEKDFDQDGALKTLTQIKDFIQASHESAVLILHGIGNIEKGLDKKRALDTLRELNTRAGALEPDYHQFQALLFVVDLAKDLDRNMALQALEKAQPLIETMEGKGMKQRCLLQIIRCKYDLGTIGRTGGIQFLGQLIGNAHNLGLQQGEDYILYKEIVRTHAFLKVQEEEIDINLLPWWKEVQEEVGDGQISVFKKSCLEIEKRPLQAEEIFREAQDRMDHADYSRLRLFMVFKWIRNEIRLQVRESVLSGNKIEGIPDAVDQYLFDEYSSQPRGLGRPIKVELA